MKYKYIYIVLVYKNTDDLIDFFKSLNTPNSHVIVVNSFYSIESEEEFRRIANKNQADFLSVENKGYGAGNNAGIEYALFHYDFDYIIISNADICIESMSITPSSESITAPNIITLKGKHQNPHTPFRLRWLEKYKYLVFTRLSSKLLYVSIAINKILRYIFYIISMFGFRTIYAPHGAFIIIPKNIITKLHPIFDEKMFLFCEEDVLAYKARETKIRVEYNPNIIVRHKEDGSVSEISDRTYLILKSSYLYYYNTYHSKL